MMVTRKFLIAVFFLVRLSYASDLPRQVAHIMRGRSGAALVVDVRSGHLLAAYHPDVAARR